MKNIVLFGMKNCGKSTLAKKIAKEYLLKYKAIDIEIEELHKSKKNESFTCREIFQKHGKAYFLQLEREVILKLLKSIEEYTIIDCSGSAPLEKGNRDMLKKIGKTILLKIDLSVNYDRAIKNGIPAFFNDIDNPKKEFKKIWKERESTYLQFADYIIEGKNETPEELLKKFKQLKII